MGTNNEQLKLKIANLLELKANKEMLEDKAKEASKIFEAASYDLLQVLEATGLDSIKAHGYTFSPREEMSVKNPQTPEDKEAFFLYLKEQGLFENMISVHSRTLNSMYKSASEDALRRGELEFRIPGIEAPTVFKKLVIRKG